MKEYLDTKGISGEKTLNIHYIRKLKAPELKNQKKVDEWIIKILPYDNGLLVG